MSYAYVTTKDFVVCIRDQDGIDITPQFRGAGKLRADDCAEQHRRGGAENEAIALAKRLGLEYRRNSEGGY